jgi:hypothetical protein
MTKPKPTPEQKAYAKAVKAQAKADEKMKQEFDAAAELAAYKAALPKRLMDAQTRAGKLGVKSEVTLTPTGPEVTFFNEEKGHYIETTLSYDSDDWEVECLERDLQLLQDRHDLAEKRKGVAQSAWGNLTEEQQSCLREYITWMR